MAEFNVPAAAQLFRFAPLGPRELAVALGAGLAGVLARMHRERPEALEKFDGSAVRPLSAGEVRQIAGRAGRFGQFEVGEFGVIARNTPPEKRAWAMGMAAAAGSFFRLSRKKAAAATASRSVRPMTSAELSAPNLEEALMAQRYAQPSAAALAVASTVSTARCWRWPTPIRPRSPRPT